MLALPVSEQAFELLYEMMFLIFDLIDYKINEIIWSIIYVSSKSLTRRTLPWCLLGTHILLRSRFAWATFAFRVLGSRHS